MQLKAAQDAHEAANERSQEMVREQMESVRRECRAVEERCKLELDQLRRTAVSVAGKRFSQSAIKGPNQLHVGVSRTVLSCHVNASRGFGVDRRKRKL